MSMTSKKTAALPRRAVLTGMAAATGAAMMPRKIVAQEQITLRWWSPQSSPEQLAAYKTQIANFEAMHENVTVVFEKTSDEGYAPQLAAAFASGDVPNVVTHLPSFAASNYWRNGLIEPFNDVIEMIGPEKFYDGANRIYEIDEGQYAGTSIGNSAANMIWLRTDLMEKAGIEKNPRTWLFQDLAKFGLVGDALPGARHETGVGDDAVPVLFGLSGQKDAAVGGVERRLPTAHTDPDADDVVGLNAGHIDHVQPIQDRGGAGFSGLLAQPLHERARPVPDADLRQHRKPQIQHLGRQIEELAVGDHVSLFHQRQKEPPRGCPAHVGFGCHLRQGHLARRSAEAAEDRQAA